MRLIWMRRLGWMLGLWLLGVAALGAVAWLLRMLMQAAGMK
jgi:Protein of unknown function (DUF2474)